MSQVNQGNAKNDSRVSSKLCQHGDDWIVFDCHLVFDNRLHIKVNVWPVFPKWIVSPVIVIRNGSKCNWHLQAGESAVWSLFVADHSGVESFEFAIESLQRKTGMSDLKNKFWVEKKYFIISLLSFLVVSWANWYWIVVMKERNWTPKHAHKLIFCLGMQALVKTVVDNFSARRFTFSS